MAKRAEMSRLIEGVPVWMLPVSQGDFETLFGVKLIGIGRVSGLMRCGTDLPRAVMEFDRLGSKSIFRTIDVLDAYMVFPLRISRCLCP